MRFRPGVIFFDQLWPYLRAVGAPLVAFAVGYFCLTLGALSAHLAPRLQAIAESTRSRLHN